MHRTKPRRLVRGGSQAASVDGLAAGRLTRSEPVGDTSAADSGSDDGPDSAETGYQQEPGSLIYIPVFYIQAPIKNEGLMTLAVVCFVIVVLLVAIWRYDLFASAIAGLRLIGR